MVKVLSRAQTSGAPMMFCIIFCLLFLNGCSRPVLTQEMFLMGAPAKITIVSNSAKAKETMQEAFALLNNHDAMMSYYTQSSELFQINAQAYKSSVRVSLDMMDILQKSLKYARSTDGFFDVTATSLQVKGGYDTIILDSVDKTVLFTDSRTKIDLGGIITGYSIDKVVKLFKARGIDNFLIDVGGDIYACGKNSHGKSWNVGIRNPFHKDTIIKTIAITDKAVTTSGNYVKKHIIDPQTQQIVSNDIMSVTVIAKKCIDADVLATGFFIMGEKKTREFLVEHSDIQVIFVVGNELEEQLIYINGENLDGEVKKSGKGV